MTVRDVVKDLDALSLTLTAELDASVERVWQLLADARQLERWWGPPEWPATFSRHDMVVRGGESRYALTGPDGETMPGWWRITAIEQPRRFCFDDGFADEHGEPVTDSPVIRYEITFESLTSARTLMTCVSTFASLEAFDELEAMGMEEGNRSAMAQLDAILAEEQ